MGSVMLMAVAVIIGLSTAAIIVSHTPTVGSSVEIAAFDVLESVEELKFAISGEFGRLAKERGAK